MIRIVTAADDFGFNDAIDAAIGELGAAGVVTATSCLVLGPRWPRAATAARRLRTTLDVGLHLDLTEFDALGSLPAIVLRSRLRLLPVARLRERIRRQLRAFTDAVGAAPDYLDGHQHVHQFPQVADALLEELSGEAPQCAAWLRLSRPPRGAGFKERLLGQLAATGLAGRVAATGRHCTGALLGVYGFDLDAAGYAAMLARMLAVARDADALMLHPASAALPGDPIGAARVVEYTVLRAPAFTSLCDRLGIEPVRGSRLFGTGQVGSDG